jgi:hypothetical protein
MAQRTVRRVSSIWQASKPGSRTDAGEVHLAAWQGQLVVSSRPFPQSLDVFRLLVVDARHGIARMPLAAKQLIELGLYGLGVAVLCALDEQRHEPDGNRGDAVPLERCWGKHTPQDCVAENDQERQRIGGQHAEVRQRTS